MNQLLSLPVEAEEPARFTVEQFLELVAVAYQFSDDKLELADGVIVRVPPPNFPHSDMQRQIFKKLDRIFGDGLDGLIATFETGSRIGDWTVRQPDLSIIRDPGRIKGLLPGSELLLAVEVAENTLKSDLGAKRRNYAEAGVPHYWVVDLQNRQVHVMHDPAEGDYREGRSVPFGEAITVPGTDQAISVD